MRYNTNDDGDIVITVPMRDMRAAMRRRYWRYQYARMRTWLEESLMIKRWHYFFIMMAACIISLMIDSLWLR